MPEDDGFWDFEWPDISIVWGESGPELVFGGGSSAQAGASVGDISLNVTQDPGDWSWLGDIISAGFDLASLFATGGDSEPNVGTLNPALDALSRAFGLGIHVDDSGRLILTEGAGGGAAGAGFFTPEAMAEIESVLNDPTLSGEAARAILAGTPEEGGALGEQFADLQGRLRGILGPATDAFLELIETGFLTDLQPIIDEQLFLFENELIPAIQERLPVSAFGSGTGQFLSTQAEKLAHQLGAAQVGLEEAAAGRQVQGLTQGLPTIQTALTAEGILPLTFAQDLLNLSQRERFDSAGGQLLSALTTLAGLGQPGYVTQGAQPSATAQTLDTLSRVAPDIVEVGQDIFGRIFDRGDEGPVDDNGAGGTGIF